jgi:hypothetical protein
MARGEPRSGAGQHRPDRRSRALLFDIVACCHYLDDLDRALPIGLGELKWDDSIGAGRQIIAGGYGNQ